MDFKALLFLLASFLLLTTKVLCNNDVFNMEIPALPQVPIPVINPVTPPYVKTPVPPPYVKAPGTTPSPPPYVRTPVTAPPPPQVPVKVPPSVPVVKPPGVAPRPNAPPQVPIKPPSVPVVKPPGVVPRPKIKTKADCYPQCGERCILNSRKNVCMRVCVTCCVRCMCVPPGPYGNREVCGTCYTGMTTHGNKSKCP